MNILPVKANQKRYVSKRGLNEALFRMSGEYWVHTIEARMSGISASLPQAAGNALPATAAQYRMDGSRFPVSRPSQFITPVKPQ